MSKIIIRHLTGSKANHVEEFDEKTSSLRIGRELSMDIKYHPDLDDTVGRQHAMIERDKNDPAKFFVKDLGSRNGTFVNKTRVNQSVPLSVGDIVQLGPNGPEFEFDLDPRPVGAMKATRVDQSTLRPTREAHASGSATRASSTVGDSNVSESGRSKSAGAEPSSGVESQTRRTGIGRTTVERLMAFQNKTNRRTIINIAAGLLIIIAAVIAFQIHSRNESRLEAAKLVTKIADTEANKPLTPEQIRKTYADAVIYIELAWQLKDLGSGKPIFHRYVGGRPAYIELPDGRYEPWLTTSDEPVNGQPTNKPVTSRGSGSGFIISHDGFALTNRHVAAGWHTRYGKFEFPGRLFKLAIDRHGNHGLTDLGYIKPDSVIVTHLSDFVPANATYLINPRNAGRYDIASLGRERSTLKNIDANYFLGVTLAKNKQQSRATLVKISDKHDVAMIKIDLPGSFEKVDLEAADDVRSGQSIVAMGYPAVSPNVNVLSLQEDFFNRSIQAQHVPDPTTTSGILSRVLQARKEDILDKDLLLSFSDFGHAYQLDINATGAGNSGGPVFNDRGKVIGIFFAGSRRGGANVTYALPISYGRELTESRKVLR